MIRRDGQLALSELTYRVGLMAGSAFMDDMFVDFAQPNFLGAMALIIGLNSTRMTSVS